MLRSILTIALFATSAAAAAQDRAQWSIGIAATTKVSLLATDYEISSKNSGFKAHAAWHPSEAWRVELAYHDFGDVDHSHCVRNRPCTRVLDPRSTEQLGLSARAAYVWNLGSVQPYAALGLVSVKLKMDSLAVPRPSSSERETGAVAEAGLDWNLSESFGLRLGYEYVAAFGNGGAAQLGVVARF